MVNQDGGGQDLDFSSWVPRKRIPGTWYKIHRLVDEGGHGRLYQAEHEITGRWCAVKAIHRKYKRVADLDARLKQEANINTRLSGYPNIAEVFDAGVTEDGRTFCAMQWLEGKNLRAALKDRAGLDLDGACFVVKSVLAALALAHGLDIVHRDVKPENIFLCTDGLVKLIDFGVAKVLNSTFVQTGRGMMPGTVRYMAPEALDGNSLAAPTMDVYALGVVFWEMLAGEHPFPQVNPQDAARAIVHDGVPPLDERPIAVATSTPALRRVVMRACARDRNARFASAEAFAEAIDGAMGYAPSARPLAAGIYPPAHPGEARPPRPTWAAAPAPAFAPRTAPERSPGTALDVEATTPRVALTDHAARSHAVGEARAAERVAAPAPPAHRSSVLVRGQGFDSDELLPSAPWLPKRAGATSDSGRSGAGFGVLSHLPPFGGRSTGPDSSDERSPSSTPPLVSGTSQKAGPRADEADGLADGAGAEPPDATTLPRRAPGARRRWWGRAPALGGVTERRPTKRAVTTGAGALLLAAFAFALGRAWKTAPEGAAAPVRFVAGGEAPAVASAPLGPPAPIGSAAAPASEALAAAPNAGPAASAREAASSPDPVASAREAASSPRPANVGAPATAPKRAGGPAPKLAGPPAGAARDARTRTPLDSRGPRRLPKGGLEPGF